MWYCDLYGVAPERESFLTDATGVWTMHGRFGLSHETQTEASLIRFNLWASATAPVSQHSLAAWLGASTNTLVRKWPPEA